MKQIFKKIAIATFILAIANVVYAQSWSINSNTDYAANFTSINAAMSSADVVAGDTLYIGTGTVLNSQTITKAVTVIGTGWGYSDSPVERSTINGNLTISADGAKIIGLHITGNVYIRYSNIIIESCKIGNFISVDVNSTLSNVKILKCLISNISGINSNSNYSTNWTIKNCIITSGSRGCIKFLYNATIENNVL